MKIDLQKQQPCLLHNINCGLIFKHFLRQKLTKTMPDNDQNGEKAGSVSIELLLVSLI